MLSTVDATDGIDGRWLLDRAGLPMASGAQWLDVMGPQGLNGGLQVRPPITDVGTQPEVADLVHVGSSLASGRGTHQFQSPNRRI